MGKSGDWEGFTEEVAMELRLEEGGHTPSRQGGVTAQARAGPIMGPRRPSISLDGRGAAGVFVLGKDKIGFIGLHGLQGD